MEDNIRERIKIVITSYNKSINSISVNKTEQRRFNRQINEGANITIETITSILDYFPDVSSEWLLKGDGNMFKKSEMTDMPIQHNEHIKGSIPFYKDLPVSAGESGLSEVTTIEKPSGYMQIPDVSAERLFPVIGCSMLPTIKPGDIIGVNRVVRMDRVDPDKIYMIITREERMLKRLRIDNEDDSVLWCVSDNYKEFKIYKSDIISVFHVVYHGELL